MGVPTDENTDFEMFGSSDNTTIQGAVKAGGANAQINGASTFTQIISLSNTDKFDSSYAGGVITNLNQINNAKQYRGYPVPESESENNSVAPSNFGSGNLIGHFGTTGFSTLSWRVIVNFEGYSQKTVTIGPSSNCFHGCGYTSASRSDGNSITGTGTINVTRLQDSSSNNNTAVNDDGDVQLVITEGANNNPRPGITNSGSPNLFDFSNSTARRASYPFSAGQTFNKTFVVENLLVADGDTFQLDITEG